MEDQPLDWLQRFFLSNCNGEWEEHYGCKIDTMADPGWMFRFDLNGTPYAGKKLARIEENYGPMNWLKCEINDGMFEAQSGPRQLEDCILVLREVIEGRR